MNITLKELQELCDKTNSEICISCDNDVLANVSDGVRRFLVSLNTLKAIDANPVQAYATLHQVSVEHYLSYMAFLKQEMKCCHKTVKGKPCEHPQFSRAYLKRKDQSPKDWIAGHKIYCTTHEHLIRQRYKELFEATSNTR